MLRGDRFTRRIDRDQLEGINKQPGLLRNKIPDIPFTVVSDIDRLSDILPPPPIHITPQPYPPHLRPSPRPRPRPIIPDIPDIPITPDLRTGGETFKKMIDTISGGASPITLYILIGAVCLVGFIAMRRK